MIPSGVVRILIGETVFVLGVVVPVEVGVEVLDLDAPEDVSEFFDDDIDDFVGLYGGVLDPGSDAE